VEFTPEAVATTRRNVLVLSLTTAILSFAVRTWWPILPIILRDRGASVVEISLAWGAFTVCASIPQLWSGVLQDRYGRKPLLALPTFVAAIAYILIAPTSPWLVTAGWLVLLNLSQGFQGQSFTVLLAESVGSHERSRAFSVFQFAIGLASVAGPALGGILLLRIGVSPLILASGVVVFLMAVARVRYLKETKSPQRQAFDFRQIFRGRALWLLIVASAFQIAINCSVNGPFVPLFLSHDRSFAPSAVNYLFSFGMLPGVVASVPIGRLIQRLGSFRSMAWALGGHFGLLALWLLLAQPFLVYVVFGLSFICYQAALIAFYVVQSDVAEGRGFGAMLGGIGMLSGIAGALGLPLAGVVALNFGRGAPFIMGGVVALVAMVTLRHLQTKAGTRPWSVQPASLAADRARS